LSLEPVTSIEADDDDVLVVLAARGLAEIMRAHDDDGILAEGIDHDHRPFDGPLPDRPANAGGLCGIEKEVLGVSCQELELFGARQPSDKCHGRPRPPIA
jgi:hypothetical protein